MRAQFDATKTKTCKLSFEDYHVKKALQEMNAMVQELVQKELTKFKINQKKKMKNAAKAKDNSL